jgi:hypothetical protein
MPVLARTHRIAHEQIEILKQRRNGLKILKDVKLRLVCVLYEAIGWFAGRFVL